MADDEISAALKIDLAEMSARFQEADRRNIALDGKIAKNLRATEVLERRHSQLETSIHRIEHKLLHAGKSIFRTALTGAATEIFAGEGEDDPGLLGGAVASGAVGLLTGGVQGLGQGLAFFFIRKLEHAISDVIKELREKSKKLEEIEKKQRDFDRQLDSEVAKKRELEAEQDREMRERIELEIRNRTQELIYQTGLALANERLN